MTSSRSKIHQIEGLGLGMKILGKKPAIIMTEEITTSKTGLGKSSNTVLIYSVVTLHKYMSHLHLINNPRIS